MSEAGADSVSSYVSCSSPEQNTSIGVQTEQSPIIQSSPDNAIPIQSTTLLQRPSLTPLFARNVHFDEHVDARSASRSISPSKDFTPYSGEWGRPEHHYDIPSHRPPFTHDSSGRDSQPELDWSKPRSRDWLDIGRNHRSRVSSKTLHDVPTDRRPSSPPLGLSPHVDPVYLGATSPYLSPENPGYESVHPYQASIAYSMRRSNSSIAALPGPSAYDFTFTSTPLSSYIFAFITDTIPRQVYIHLLLRLPALYHSRVARIFNDAQLSLPVMKKLALENDDVGPEAYPGLYPIVYSHRYPPLQTLQNTWEAFIDSVLREWKTFNIVSVLLLSAILTVLQINSAAANPVARFSALLSLICAMMSLIFGGIYIISFGRMRRTYKAMGWAEEAQRTKTAIFWNIWVLLAMPAVWLSWSLISYLVCIMAFVWQTGTSSEIESPVLSFHAALAPRIIISSVLVIGLFYFGLILDTLRHYGDSMDLEWRERVKAWRATKSHGYSTGFSRHAAHHKPSHESRNFDSFVPSYPYHSYPTAAFPEEQRMGSPPNPSPFLPGRRRSRSRSSSRDKRHERIIIPARYDSPEPSIIVPRSHDTTFVVIPPSSSDPSEDRGSSGRPFSRRRRTSTEEQKETHSVPRWDVESPNPVMHRREDDQKFANLALWRYTTVGRFDVHQGPGGYTFFEDGSFLEDSETTTDPLQRNYSASWRQFIQDMREAWDRIMHDLIKPNGSSQSTPQMSNSLLNSGQLGNNNIRRTLDLWYSSFFVHHAFVPFICEEYSLPGDTQPSALWVHLFKEPVHAESLMKASSDIASWRTSDHCVWVEGRNRSDSSSLRLRIDYPLITDTVPIPRIF